MAKQRKSCANCGGIFERLSKYSNAQWDRRIFCSRRCAVRRLTDADERQMCLLYSSGLSSAQIGERCGISATHVRRVLKSHGVNIRSLSEGKVLRMADPELRLRISKARKGFRNSEGSKEKLRATIGPDHPSWKGGLTVSAGGYLCFTASAANGAHSCKALHRVVAEALIGPVSEGHHVHHKDGNKWNNDPRNLEILSASDHAAAHKEDRENGKRSKQV